MAIITQVEVTTPPNEEREIIRIVHNRADRDFDVIIHEQLLEEESDLVWP